MKRLRAILFCAAAAAALGAAHADEAADRRVVESKTAAVRSLLSVVRSQPAGQDTARQAEAILARAEDQAKAQRWGEARRSLEEAQAILAAATPRAPPQPAGAPTSASGAEASASAEQRLVESKMVAVKSLLGVVRGEPGREETAKQADALIGEAEAAARARQWDLARRSLERAQLLLIAAAPKPQAGPTAAPSQDQSAAASVGADRRVVESKVVAVRSLLGVVRATGGAEESARRAEALMARADAQAGAQAWKQARGELEEAELILIAAVPRPHAAPVAEDPAKASAEARAASDHRVYEAKRVAVGSLLAVVRGQQDGPAAVKRAEALIAQADAQASERKWPDARASLEQAQGVLMAAVPAPAPVAKHGSGGPGSSEANERQYRARRESVDALRDALQRIGSESPQSGASARPVLESTRGQLEFSAGLARQGRFVEARDLLDQAYLLLKVNIEGLRRGQTLVHEKKFASAEEEYAYERDRSDSYILLVRMFIGWDGQGTAPRHGERVASGLSVRRDAETLAAGGKHADAVKSMEQSTLILTQVLRLLGLPIP